MSGDAGGGYRYPDSAEEDAEMRSDLPPDAVVAALAAVRARHDDEDEFRKDVEEDRDVMLLDTTVALAAAAPHIDAAARASERAAIAAVISPDQFRKLADWFDTDDEFKEAMFPETWSPGSRQNDVQRDLRRVADLIGGTQS